MVVLNKYSNKPETVIIGTFRRGMYAIFLALGIKKLENDSEYKYQGYGCKLELTSLDIYEFIDKVPAECLIEASEDDIQAIMKTFHADNDVTAWGAMRTKQVEVYDESDYVKNITINGVTGKLEKDTRVGLVNMYNMYNITDKWKTSNVPPIWIGNTSINMKSPSEALEILGQIEQYSFECFDATKRNLVSIQDLVQKEVIQSLMSFDFKTNYPPTFDIEV